MKIELDLKSIEQDLKDDAILKIKESIQKTIESKSDDHFLIGYSIKQHIKSWVDSNLEFIVRDYLNNKDLKPILDKAIQIAVQNKVHSFLKSM